MEKNEAAFRNKVLSHLYGIPDPTETAFTESGEDTADETKDKENENKDEEKTVTDKDKDSPSKLGDQESEASEEKEKEEADNENENETVDNNSASSDASIVIADASNDSTKTSTTTSTTTTTTTTSHLYTVLMAPLDGRGSLYRGGDLSTRSSGDEQDGSQKKRMRLENSSDKDGADFTQSAELSGNPSVNADNSVGMDLSKNQKKKLKKKRRKHLLNKLEVQRAKEFIYSSENEQYSVEKLRTMIEDVTEFLDAIWDVYCSEARLKGESVEDLQEDGYRAAAVLKCLSASGEGSWVDLQLLSRAKSVLVLRSKNLAASTIARVENELGYDSDIRSFIVRMLRFWMDEVVNKG